MQPEMKPGEVWLVGAGPGSVDLLTLKAARLIGQADVIFHDALVGADTLALSSPHAQIINVGKRAGRHSMPQAAICDCLVEAALAGLRVVRLKGGDPGIFGRATEELEALKNAGIAAQIVPGVTTACAAAATAGISLTQRGTARRLQIITAHVRNNEPLLLDWKKLADPKTVLAIYMGKAAAQEISRELIAAGLPADHPVIAIEHVSAATEKKLYTTLGCLADTADVEEMDGPVMLLIGAAAPEHQMVRTQTSADVPDAMPRTYFPTMT
jgi:uroporphyrin-III C-methyltransferase